VKAGIAGALAATAPLAAFLTTNEYPVFTPEAAALLLVCAGIGAAVALAAALSPVLGALLLGGGTALALDFLYGAHFSKAALVLVPVACVALALLLRRHIALVVTAAASVFIIATVLIPAPAADAAGEKRSASDPPAGGLPVVLHLVLDEHIGLDGLPQDLAETAELARWLGAAYVERGFRLYAGAYSQYFDTRNALANLLNFTSEASPWAHLVKDRSKPYVLSDSAYFRHLTARGYRLHVYHSDHIDLCRVPGQRYARCVGYLGNSIGAIDGAPLATGERVQFIANSFLETSQYFKRLRDLYGRLRASVPELPLPAWEPGVSRVGPLAVLPVIEALERDLRSAAPGEAYFAHLLIPHYPYVLDESCRLRERIEEWFYNDTGSRAERYRRYAAQIRCQQALLDRLFGALEAAGVWDRAIVVVHGDHGSRILESPPVARNADRLTREDFRAGYSTLFAVRRPGLAAGIEPGLAPLQPLLGGVFAIPTAPLAAKVYLRSPGEAPLVGLSLTRLVAAP
jgi:hypothetical protein